VLPRFTGPIEQVPPAYSALKVDGERAYDLAGEAWPGETVETESAAVTVHGRASHRRSCTERCVRMVPLPLKQVTLDAPMSPKAPISAASRAILRWRSAPSAMSPCCAGCKAGPFDRWIQAISLDNLNAIGKGAPLENVILPLEAGLVDIPALTSARNRQGRSDRAGFWPGWPMTMGFTGREAGDLFPWRWWSFRAVTPGSSGASTFPMSRSK
jgi:tRNA pseudouridine55 synthase